LRASGDEEAPAPTVTASSDWREGGGILYFGPENERTDGNALFLLQLYLPLSLRGSGHGEAHARGSWLDV